MRSLQWALCFLLAVFNAALVWTDETYKKEDAWCFTRTEFPLRRNKNLKIQRGRGEGVSHEGGRIVFAASVCAAPYDRTSASGAVGVCEPSEWSARVNPSPPLQAHTNPYLCYYLRRIDRSDYRACRRSWQPLHSCLSAHNTRGSNGSCVVFPKIRSKGGLRAACVVRGIFFFLTRCAVVLCRVRVPPRPSHRGAKTFIGSSKILVDMSVLLAGEVEVAGGNGVGGG